MAMEGVTCAVPHHSVYTVCVLLYTMCVVPLHVASSGTWGNDNPLVILLSGSLMYVVCAPCNVLVIYMRIPHCIHVHDVSIPGILHKLNNVHVYKYMYMYLMFRPSLPPYSPQVR